MERIWWDNIRNCTGITSFQGRFRYTKGNIYDDRSARVSKPSNNFRAIKSESLDEQIVADCYEDRSNLATSLS